MALIRYPGSKAKLVTEITERFPDNMKHALWSSAKHGEYREPFFGSGAIGFQVLESVNPRCAVRLNDIDADLICLWQSVLDSPLDLIRYVSKFTPSVEAFFQFKSEDGSNHSSRAYRGFRKLALHRMSVSGFGVMAGGPIGGKMQEHQEYNVGCRWNPERIKADIGVLHNLLKQFRSLEFTALDFEAALSGGDTRTFVYLDPPYYAKGSQLYKFSMPDESHVRLADILRHARFKWVLSYDDHPRIRELYKWAQFEAVVVKYSNAVTRNAFRPKNKEIVITPCNQ